MLGLINTERITKMKKKNNWFWNVIIVLTIVGCGFAFVLHYKNWISFDDGIFEITSGVYSQDIPVSKINTIALVKRLPEMERVNGFSWLAKEKGIFLDSISGNKAYVFVDDLRQQKIMLSHQDSLVLYVNLADSIATHALYNKLNTLVNENME